VALADLVPASQQPTGAEAKPEKGALWSYAKSDKIYVCPGNRDGEYKRLTYSMNCAIAGMNGRSRMRSPGDIILLVDEARANDGFFWAFNANATYGSPSTDALNTDHVNGGSLLMCDGSAKFYAYNKFPLDSDVTPEATTLKIRMDGSPRFWDKAFDLTTPYGDTGYYNPSVVAPATQTPFGTCALPNG
jgi:hypothetical protein